MQETTHEAPNHTALVTGASSGIGLELARLLAADGYDLVLVARRERQLRELAEELEQSHGTDCVVMPVDLSDPEAGWHLEQELADRELQIDVLVNNAGFGVFGRMIDNDPRQERDMIQVNITAATELIQRLLPGMVERGSGRILNVASAAGFQPGPLMAVYYASKAYLLHLSEALAEELRDTGVTVTALCPGPTRTGFQEAADMETSGLVAGRSLPDGAVVARAGYRAMQRGERVHVPGLRNRLLAFLIRLTPRRLVPPIVRRIQERR